MAKQKKNIDILVIGGGVIGASIFHHLVKVGYKVVLLEKNQLVSGCTALSGGIVRGFHLHSSLADKAVYGWHYYNEFEKQTGIACEFTRSGFFYFPEQHQFNFAKNEVARLRDLFPIEWLDASAVTAKLGDILVEKPQGAVYEPNSGFMDPVKVSHAWFTSAKALGGVIYENATVTNLHVTNHGFQSVTTSIGKFSAKKIILALGPYTPRFLDQTGIHHDLYTQVIQVDIRRPEVIQHQQPAFIDDNFNLNGRPNYVMQTQYIGHPTYLRINCPTECTDIDSEHSEKIRVEGAKRWSLVKQSHLVKSLRTSDCYRKEGLGLVKAVDESQSIFVATGFSGGGFKVAPWIGHEIQQLTQMSF